HHVHLKIPFEHLRLDFEKRSPASSDRVVDEQIRGAVLLADVGNSVGGLALAGNVADHRVCIRQLLLQRADAIRRTRQRDDAKSFAREAPDNRGPGAGTDARNYGNWFVSHRGLARTCIGTAWAFATTLY